MVDTPTAFATKPTLHGERVTLRSFRDDDLPLIREALNDPEVNRLTGSMHTSSQAPSTPEEPLRAWYSTRHEQGERLDLMIEERATGLWVGEVVLNEWDEGNQACGFRILIGPGGQNRGLGSEATRLIVDYAFEHLPLHRIELEVYAFNPRAQQVYTKAGFVVEGRRRDALLYDGERIDAILMSILRPDWESRRSPE